MKSFSKKRLILLAALLGWLVGTFSADAQSSSGIIGKRIDSDALRKLVSGNTISGYHLHIVRRFGEYHSPDGRVFGHSGAAPVYNGCWDVVGDAVCYYYQYEGQPRSGSPSCWVFRQTAVKDQYRIESTVDASGIAVYESGNPHDLSDNGVRWECTPLTSQRNAPGQSKIARVR